MNDTTMIGRGQVEDVRAYVAAVRAWLGRPAGRRGRGAHGRDGGRPRRARGRVGRPAGRPARPARGVRRRAAVRGRAAAARRRRACRMPCRASRGPTAWSARRTSWWPGIRGCASCDRPGGWPRGAVAGWALASVLGTGRVLLLPLVGAALSVWLGLVLRRREPLGTGVRLALGVGNALAVVLLLPMLAFYTSGLRRLLRPGRVRAAGGSGARGERVSRSPTCTPMTPPGNGWTMCGSTTSPASRCVVARRRAGADWARRAGARRLAAGPARPVGVPDAARARGRPVGGATGGLDPALVVVPLAGSAQPSATPSPSTSTSPSASATASPSPAPTPDPHPEPEPVTAESGAQPAAAGDRLSTRRAGATRLQ